MGDKLCPKLILEGTRLTYKTDLAFALNEHPDIVGVRKYRYHSPLISGEWCGFTNTPWGRGLTSYAPHEHDQAMETYATWARLFELLRYYSWVVDRFHISTRAHLRRDGRDAHFGWLEERLVPLGFRLVFCVRRPETFEAARTERLKISGNPSQYDDLQPFIAEQALMRTLVAQSALPVLELDVSDGDVGAAAQRVADWLRDTDGLTYPE